MALATRLLCLCVSVAVLWEQKGVNSSELRRNDDLSGWEIVVQSLSQKVDALEAKLQALENSQGRFSPPLSLSLSLFLFLSLSPPLSLCPFTMHLSAIGMEQLRS